MMKILKTATLLCFLNVGMIVMAQKPVDAENPVIRNFSASYSAGEKALVFGWSLSTEENAVFCVRLEKSKDGKDFSTIAVFDNNFSSYTYRKSVKGENYFKITVMDTEGNILGEEMEKIGSK